MNDDTVVQMQGTGCEAADQQAAAASADCDKCTTCSACPATPLGPLTSRGLDPSGVEVNGSIWALHLHSVTPPKPPPFA